MAAADDEGSKGSFVEVGNPASEEVKVVGTSSPVVEPTFSSSPPRTSLALCSSTHATLTPAADSIGIAKHLFPSSQVLNPNFPAALQLPIFPSMHATVPC